MLSDRLNKSGVGQMRNAAGPRTSTPGERGGGTSPTTIGDVSLNGVKLSQLDADGN